MSSYSERAEDLANQIIEATGGDPKIARETIRLLRTSADSLGCKAAIIEANGRDFNEANYPEKAWDMENPTDPVSLALDEEAMVIHEASNIVRRKLDLDRGLNLHF